MFTSLYYGHPLTLLPSALSRVIPYGSIFMLIMIINDLLRIERCVLTKKVAEDKLTSLNNKNGSISAIQRQKLYVYDMWLTLQNIPMLNIDTENVNSLFFINGNYVNTGNIALRSSSETERVTCTQIVYFKLNMPQCTCFI